jgi:hypothetical protein
MAEQKVYINDGCLGLVGVAGRGVAGLVHKAVAFYKNLSKSVELCRIGRRDGATGLLATS